MTGSQGPTGPAGPPGLGLSRAGYYQVDREGLFIADGGVVLGTATIFVQCANSADIPVAGSCDGQRTNDPVVLIFNRPVNWSAASGATAAWECQWNFANAASQTDLPSVAGHIVCLKPDAGM